MGPKPFFLFLIFKLLLSSFVIFVLQCCHISVHYCLLLPRKGLFYFYLFIFGSNEVTIDLICTDVTMRLLVTALLGPN